ncbi:MAG: DNA primase [Betaproteobacteria bacterium]|nr:DNA primase [Betaproteobacteria bacterium]
MIPQDFIQQLLARVDIVDVIDKHVKLKKAGQNYSACCPFHNEKTPSFSVSPTKQFYHCFGCGVHGTAISFLMEYSGMGFRDAVQELSENVGMTLPVEANREESLERAKEAASLGEVMLAAMNFYRRELKRTPKAIDYFKSRGVSGEIAAKFGLGYSPDDWQGLKGAVEDYTASALNECGLVIDNDEGKRYDRFRDRVMFPILDARGNVIGFGGRVIGQGEPKYLNSPETPLFEKGRELYGLFQARRAIRDSQTAIIVEGYMDVVALAQAGVENAVATLGTATTPTHVQKLLRMADNLVFSFDGDKAGRKAAWRALEQSLPVLADGKDVRFLFLPAEDDPDTFVRRLGKEAFLAELKIAKPLSAYLFDELSSQVDLDNEEGRSRFLTYVKPLISQITAPAMAMMLQRKLADLIGLGLVEIQRLIPIASANAPQSTAEHREATSKQSGNAPDRPKGERGFSRNRFRGPEPGAPVPRRKSSPAGLAAQIIARILLKPGLAGRFDITVADDDPSVVGVASRVAAFVRDHDFEVTQAQVIEHFRGSADESELERAACHPLLTDMETAHPDFDLDAEFDEALARLRDEAIAAQKKSETLRRARDMGLS